jgi:hypothetical protein
MRPTIAATLLTLTFGLSVWGQDQPPIPYDPRPKINVSGEAVVNVKPDKIIISFGIQTSDAEIAIAKQKNNDILKKAVTAMKDCGILDKDIQTDNLSIEPRYQDGEIQANFIGYFVRNTFAVTVNDTQKVEDVVSRALEAGVNYIHGIDFQTTEFRKYRDQARELALKAAKEKADAMAAVLGQTVGVPLQINENQSGSPWWYGSSGWGWGGGRSQGMAQNVMQDAGPATTEISDTIALGKISIRANVTVTFALKQ